MKKEVFKNVTIINYLQIKMTGTYIDARTSKGKYRKRTTEYMYEHAAETQCAVVPHCRLIWLSDVLFEIYKEFKKRCANHHDSTLQHAIQCSQTMLEVNEDVRHGRHCRTSTGKKKGRRKE